MHLATHRSPARRATTVVVLVASLPALALAVVLVVALAVLLRDEAVAVLVALLLLAGAAGVDARTGRLPDPLVAAAGVPIAVVSIDAGLAGDRDLLVGVLAGAALLGLPMLAVHLVSPVAMGFGDVKLAVALGLVVGVVEPRLALLALCVGTGATAAWALASWRRSAPLGPGLVLAGVAAIAVATATGEPVAWR